LGWFSYPTAERQSWDEERFSLLWLTEDANKSDVSLVERLIQAGKSLSWLA